jgi:hypothetical protein
MINWPVRGNDYGEGVGRLVESPSKQQQFLQEARWHTQSFARFIQTQLGRRYGLAEQAFPYSLLPIAPNPLQGHRVPHSPFAGGAYALHPYYRESRRLQGLVTLREQDILPVAGGRVASLPMDVAGRVSAIGRQDTVASIAVGNYPNDHHYPGINFPLKPKSLRWGGRWTGTPFTIPYGCLVPVSTDALLVCEKNISVSHMANGATRLQPIVMNIGQAAGMAAALCIELGCQPRDLPVRRIQEALLQDPVAPAAIIPLFNLPPNHPDWLYWQRYYLDNPEDYPSTGNVSFQELKVGRLNVEGLENLKVEDSNLQPATFFGIFQRRDEQDYMITLLEPAVYANQTWMAIALQPEIDEQLQNFRDQQPIRLWGHLNGSGGWLVVEKIDESSGGRRASGVGAKDSRFQIRLYS